MTRHELALEMAMTDEAAAQLCARLSIPTSSPEDVIGQVDAERFRAAARADLALGSSGESRPAPSAESPFAAPDPIERSPGTGDDVSAGWAAPEPTGAWAPATNGHGEHPPGQPGPGPAPTAGVAGQPSWARSADQARLDAARRRANSFTNSGYALLAVGLAITLATLYLAGGGFFIISFGFVFVGFRRLRTGRMLRAQIRDAEQRLGPDGPA